MKLTRINITDKLPRLEVSFESGLSLLYYESGGGGLSEVTSSTVRSYKEFSTMKEKYLKSSFIDLPLILSPTNPFNQIVLESLDVGYKVGMCRTLPEYYTSYKKSVKRFIMTKINYYISRMMEDLVNGKYHKEPIKKYRRRARVKRIVRRRIWK